MADFMEMLNPQGQAQAPGQPQPPGAPIEGPPTSNEEMVARKGGWGQFFDTVRTNPGLQQAMMFMAAKMMQPLQQGETVGGNVGQAMFGGASIIGSGQDAEFERQQKAQETARRNEFVGAQTEAEKARTQKYKQETQFAIEDRPGEKRAADLKAKYEAARVRVEEAKAKGLEAQNPVEMAKLELQLAKAKVVAEQALVGARNRANAGGNGPDQPSFAERKYEEQQALEDKAALLYEREKADGIAALMKGNKKLTLTAASEQWTIMNPFNAALYRAKARSEGKVPEQTAGLTWSKVTGNEPTKPRTIAEIDAELAAKGSGGTAPEGKLLSKVPSPPLYDPIVSMNDRQTARIRELTKLLSERYDANLYAELQALKNAQLQSQIPMTFPGR